jgi:hypothetical protein
MEAETRRKKQQDGKLDAKGAIGGMMQDDAR